jgi:Fic family protein
MHSLRKLENGISEIPAGVAWYIADIMEYRGKQALYTSQSPQKLKHLRESSIIESSISSTRIEGVVMDASRVVGVLQGRTPFRDRDEEEIKGYRDALDWIHSEGSKIPINIRTVLELHSLVRSGSGSGGKFKTKQGEGDIFEILPDGRKILRFATVPHHQVKKFMIEWEKKTTSLMEGEDTHPLIVLCASSFDFLCIHPFSDGNGRVSRLLFLLHAYHAGIDVGRYVSLEKIIEENKEEYYRSLKVSSAGWHDAKHDVWPYIRYMLYILKTAYREMAERMESPETRGAKTGMIENWIKKRRSDFTLSEIQQALPSVSRDMIRKVLKDMSRDNRIQSYGHGRSAVWRKK